MKIFNTPPKGTGLLAKWTDAKFFELENYINDKSMSLDQTLVISNIFNTSSKTGFEGQIKVNETIGLYKSGKKYYETYNINKIAQPFGIGRIVGPDYIFEGYIDIDSFNNNKTTSIFRIITETSVTVYNSKIASKAEIEAY